MFRRPEEAGLGRVGEYLVLVAAGEREAHGTEIWWLPSIWVSQWLPSMWLVVHPRLLIVRLKLAGADCVLVVAHAPHNDPGWWDGFPAKLRRVSVPGLLVVVLAEANAHIGSVRSGSVRDVGSGQESLAGSAFHRAVCDLDLAVPATFMGSALLTSRSMTGFWPGNDFVFLPMPWLGRCVDAKVDETAALARSNREDHLLVSVVVQWPVRRAKRRDVVPDEAEKAMTAKSMMMLEKHTPRCKPAPRKTWVTEDASVAFSSACGSTGGLADGRAAVSGVETDLSHMAGQGTSVSCLLFSRAVALQYLYVGKRETAAVRTRAKEDWLDSLAQDISDDWKPGGGSKLWHLATRCLGKQKAPLRRRWGRCSGNVGLRHSLLAGRRS